MEQEGRIIKGIGGFYYVDTGERVVECRARGKFRKMGIVPLVGDWAEISLSPDGSGYLMNLAPRKNFLNRPAVANLDCLVIVASEAAPITDPFLIDKVSVLAVSQSIAPILVVNKCDVHSGESLRAIYGKAGFPVLCVSAQTGENVDALREMLNGKLSAFTGNSGVGKSTLLNAIAPGAGLETGSINDKIGRGRHTTRQVELIALDAHTWIADTPGFSAFELDRSQLEPERLPECFPEFVPYLGQCDFQGCAHLKDRGCAVRAAGEQGKIAPSRLESYEKILHTLQEMPEWQSKNAGKRK